MNQKRMMVLVGVAVLIGLAASNFVYTQFKKMTAERKTVSTAQLVVSAKALPLGTRLEKHHLRLITWPANAPMPGMFTRQEECIGRALITSLEKNEPILAGKLAPESGGSGLQATIPFGMRGVSVKVNDVVAVAGFVLPGTMVDVLATGTPGGRSGGSQTNTRIILENIRVLAAGQKIEQDKDGKPQKVAVITLLVTPEQANQLTFPGGAGRGGVEKVSEWGGEVSSRAPDDGTHLQSIRLGRLSDPNAGPEAQSVHRRTSGHL